MKPQSSIGTLFRVSFRVCIPTPCLEKRPKMCIAFSIQSMEAKKNSHTGTRTRVGEVKTRYPNRLDYMGLNLDSTRIYKTGRTPETANRQREETMYDSNHDYNSYSKKVP